MPKKISAKKLAYLIKDEHKAAKDYMKMGLPKLAHQESEHAKFFEKLKKKR